MTLPLRAGDPRGRAPGGAPEPSVDGLSRALVLASAAAWIVLAGVKGWPRWGAAVLLAVGGTAGWLRGKREPAALALATAALAAFSALGLPVMWTWVLLAVVSALLVSHRFAPPWLVRGELSRAVVAWIAATIAVSAAALMGWWALLRPDLSGLPLPAWFRALPSPAVAALFVAWASLNAVAEELYFRGVMQYTLVRTLGRAGVLVQAVAFGVMHLRGFPSGAAGVALATVYGLMVGALRERAGGLLAPWIAHVAADLVIALILSVAGR